MPCPICGATQNVHGDCLVCDAPLGAPRARTVYVRDPGPWAATREPAGRTIEAVVRALAGRWPASLVEEHLRGLPAWYMAHHPPEVIARHLALIERAAGGTTVEHSRTGSVDRLTVVTPDRLGLLELLSGTLMVRLVNIAAATAYTRADGTVIDVIEVDSSCGSLGDGGFWRGVCDDLTRALITGRFPSTPDDAPARPAVGRPPGRGVIPTAVYVHNVPSERFSKIEVNAADRRGLLHAITRALRERSINVHFANIETTGMLAVDTFYVSDRAGHRLDDPDAIERLKGCIVSQIEALGQP